jgi:hypothetical protein
MVYLLIASRQVGIEHIIDRQILFNVMGMMHHTLRDSEEAGAR